MKKKILLVASSNLNKVREIKKYFSKLPYKIIGLNDMNIFMHVEETFTSYKENAMLKATKYGEVANILTLADDSGLEVKALKGRPGVFSARYEKGSDSDRNTKILKELINIPKTKRKAQYQCIMALHDPKRKKCKTFSGIVKGEITTIPIGNKGFGYDPIFYYPKAKKTFAQMTMADKEKYSHRGRALEKVRNYLSKQK